MKARARPYRQSSRAAAAEATGQRIVRAFSECMRSEWFDAITVDAVARRAGVTTRTVIRRFGGKDGLLEAFVADFLEGADLLRAAEPGDAAGAVSGLIDLYEEWGDGVIRNLAQEPRHPELKPLLDSGRRRHRAATAASYAPWLGQLPAVRRRQKLDALVAATDVYLWHLLRRGLGRSRPETEKVMLMMVEALLEDRPVPDAAERKA